MLRWVSIISIFGLMLGCATQERPSPPPGGAEFAKEEYRIGVGDKLAVRVWRNEELRVDVPVRPDGKISVPLVGDVLAAGQTVNALATEITNKMTAFIRTPQVTVIVMDPVSTDFLQRVRVTGAVKSPISIPFRKGMTVLDLVLIAGGANDFADANSAVLYRQTVNGVQMYPIKLSDILKQGKLDTNYPLLPSDVITVPERLF